MQLQGSCRCGAVTFSLMSHTPVPYMRCYCSICRKCDGGGGYAINIMGMLSSSNALLPLRSQKDSMQVEGEESLKEYAVMLPKEEGEEGNGTKLKPSSNVRSFCGKCGTHVWAYDETWAHWIYPFASAIDTDLPATPHSVHIMLGSKASWVEPQVKEDDQQFEEYPELGIEEWHKKHGCYVE